MKPNRYLIFASMGVELVGLIIGCLFIGQVLDEKFGTKGLMVIFFSIASLVGWFVHLIFLLKRIDRMEEQDAKRPKL
ncbi:MAG: AtpZ/AtpI family protein [Bdellovibrionaceae bacterium]|nr:AtpZ/AtpI family protein [Pseudobdellovibrionaceae bacterium]